MDVIEIKMSRCLQCGQLRLACVLECVSCGLKSCEVITMIPKARIADLERQLQEAVGLFKELRGTIKAASHRLEEAANSGVRFLDTHGLLVTGLRKIDDFVKGSPNGE